MMGGMRCYVHNESATGSPGAEEAAAVLAILVEAGVLRYEDDGTLLRLGDDGGYEVLCRE